MSDVLIVLGAITLMALMAVGGSFLGYGVVWIGERGYKHVRRYIREHRRHSVCCAHCGEGIL